jgi:hypothetical protein
VSGNVTYCKKCKSPNWAGKKRCEVCGGELEPTLHEVHAYYYNTYPEFKEMVDKNHQSLGENK